MPDNFKRNKESELIRKFEEHLKNLSAHFFDIEAFDEIINHYLSEGDDKKALKACDLAEIQHPFSVDILLLKAQTFSNLERYDSAIEALDQAESYQPNEPEIFMIRGSIYHPSGQASLTAVRRLFCAPY